MKVDQKSHTIRQGGAGHCVVWKTVAIIDANPRIMIE
jgi:hypothetical protein